MTLFRFLFQHVEFQMNLKIQSDVKLVSICVFLSTFCSDLGNGPELSNELR